jgi:hypothetical protein
MHFDSFSLGVRHLFQKLVLFFLCEVILVYVFPFKKKKICKFSLEALGAIIYVTLVDRFVAYSQSFNLVYR